MEDSKDFIESWASYLQDTRNEMYEYCVSPIQDILNNDTLTVENKLEEIQKVNLKASDKFRTWDVKNYGIFVNGSQ